MKELQLRLNCHWLSVLVLLLFSTEIISQQTLKVVSEQDEALVSVFITVNDTILTTDKRGTCVLPVNLNAESLLVFKYLGYKELSLLYKNLSGLNFRVQLKPDLELLEEIVIIGRTQSSEKDFPNPLKRIASDEIFSTAAQNSADAIEMSGGAFVQRSQMGGGSPILRGFEANKVLLVVDGIRMNNAIYRNGHLQNAVTVDPAMLEQMDIIFGAGSLLYGSEALGGIIHFKSKSAKLNFDPQLSHRQELNSYVRYNSSNHEKRIHLDYGYGKNNWAVLTSLSFVDFDDLRTGRNRSEKYPEFGTRPDFISTDDTGVDRIVINDDQDIQLGTAYLQFDFMQKWNFKLSKDISSEWNIQYSTSGDVPRYDNLIARRDGNPRFAEWYYGPQNRFLLAHQLDILAKSPYLDKAIIIASFQDIDEDRVSRVFESNQREFQFEDIQVYGLSIDLQKQLNKQNRLLYGVDLQFNKLQSEAFILENPYSDHPTRLASLLSRYPSGGSTLLNTGAYIQHIWQDKKDKIGWINGLRYSWQESTYSYLSSDPYSWPEYFYEGIESRNSALVGISALKMSLGTFQVNLSSGTSFRSPNIDDLAKVRINNNEITIPNPDLTAETVWNNELSLSWNHDKVRLSTSLYYSFLDDVIVRQNSSLPDGSRYFITQGDSLLVTANRNAESGSIKGVSVQMDLYPSKNLEIRLQFNAQTGESKDEEGMISPLGHIPPSFGHARIEYKKENIKARVMLRYNGWKNIEDYGGSVDNPELATADGSPSFAVLSTGLDWQINESWSLTAGINNILDTHYRAFSSGVSGAGRHIHAALSYRWTNESD